MTAPDAAIRTKLDALAKALREYHSALLDFAKGEYEFLHGAVKNPYELFSLVTNDESFQWLRPLSGLMATLDEVIDAKGTTLSAQNVTDARHALGLLFSDADSRFSNFRAGHARAMNDSRVRETEAHWRELLSSVEA